MSAAILDTNEKPTVSHTEKFSQLYAGIHPQEDRDARFATKAAGAEKQFWNMIRLRIPLGQITAEQYRRLDEISESATYNRSLRVTAGQGIQLHGVRDADVKSVVAQIESAGLASGCHSDGFEFAVATSPMPLRRDDYEMLRELSAAVCKEFYPKPGRGEIPHPEHQPRKFTIGLGLMDDNTANIFANDVGLLLVNSPGGFKVNVLAGGSLSMPGRRADTYARLGSMLGAVDVDDVISVIKAITRVFARHGDLATRRHTRLKYIVDELGVENFRGAVEEELGFPLRKAVEFGELRNPSWFGAGEQGDGFFFYGLGVPNGRIQDLGFKRYKSAIRMIVDAFRPGIVLAPDQNILFTGLRGEQIEALEKILSAYHIPFGKHLSRLRFEAMACAGLPTCPLAVAESERVAEPILDALEAELFRIGKKDSPFTFRISGCSIGCIRPNMVDLGAVGRKPGHYDVFVGGSEASARFGELYAACVPLEEIVPTIRPLLEFWGKHGAPDETFSNFYARTFGLREKKKTRLVFAEAVPARDRIDEQMRRFPEFAET